VSIVEVLLERGLITPEHLSEAMDLRKEKGVRLDRALVKLGCLTEESLLQVMSEQLSIPLVDLSSVRIDVDTLRSLPAKLVFRKHLVPVARDNGSLTVATNDPFDLYAFDELRLLTGLEIHPALAPEEEIDKAIKAHYGVGGETIDETTWRSGIGSTGCFTTPRCRRRSAVSRRPSSAASRSCPI